MTGDSRGSRMWKIPVTLNAMSLINTTSQSHLPRTHHQWLVIWLLLHLFFFSSWPVLENQLIVPLYSQHLFFLAALGHMDTAIQPLLILGVALKLHLLDYSSKTHPTWLLWSSFQSWIKPLIIQFNSRLRSNQVWIGLPGSLLILPFHSCTTGRVSDDTRDPPQKNSWRYRCL